MSEVRFHHLERRRVDEALPRILERALEEGRRVLVRASSEEMAAALNERLWTYDDASFLPHGAAGDGDPETQPIFLTCEADNPNAATMLVRLSAPRPPRATRPSSSLFLCSTDATRRRSSTPAPNGGGSRMRVARSAIGARAMKAAGNGRGRLATAEEFAKSG